MNIGEVWMSLELGLIFGIVAVGIYLSFRVIDFPDLTCDGSFVLGGATSAILIKLGISPIYSLFCGFITGGLAGLATGILYIKLSITNLLSGILVAFVLYSINLKVMGNVPNIALINQSTIFTGHNELFILALFATLIWLLISYLLITDFGLALRSIGQNSTLALTGGVKVKTAIVITLMLSNGLIGLGGALFVQHQGFADISQGVGTVIIGLVGVMIGERLFPFHHPIIKISACIIGSILYRFLIAFALHSEILGIQTQDLNLMTGCMVIGMMLIPYGGKRNGYA